MNFGKLPDLRGVDLSLPPDHPRTAEVLARAGQSDSPLQVYLGATGWSNKEWVGTYYPPKTRPQDYLYHYSRLFNTIEHNTTHYRIPDADLVERWRDLAAPGFVFCPKVPQTISHYLPAGGGALRPATVEQTLRFAEVMDLLGDRLGAHFVQLPDRHGPVEADSLVKLLRLWPVGVPLHWELRHPDWFTMEGGPAGEFWEALEASGHGMVITDVAGRRDVLHMRLTTPVLMLRFVGNGLHPTDYARTNAWLERLAVWRTQGLRAAYIFIHQPEVQQVPAFTGYWAEGLNRVLGMRLQVPKALPQAGVQGTLF